MGDKGKGSGTVQRTLPRLRETDAEIMTKETMSLAREPWK